MAAPPETLPDALAALRTALRALALGLEVPGAVDARARRDELVAQITDHLLPRLRDMDAPMLMVVGGSTGAGKSTLVNSLVGEPVSAASVLRPTTRAPVLVCHPDDRRWFEGERILPGLPRTVRPPGEAVSGPPVTSGVQIVPSPALPPGLALLDSPDIDSVVEANRELARQLLAAADAWLFVTTAARYADAVPWDLLHAARERGTALSVVLNRVPADAAEVRGHLEQMLAERGLGGTEVLEVPEAVLVDDRLPAPALAPVRARLDALAADASERDALVRRTLTGALDSLPARTGAVLAAADEQAAAAGELRGEVERAYGGAIEEVDEAVRSGSLLRGEVLARWHDVVGTGELMRALETRVGRLRDRLRTLVTGGRAPDAELRAAVESSVDGLVHTAADRAAERAAAGWRARPAGRVLLLGAERMDAASSGLLARTRDEVRGWQGFVFELVEREGADKRQFARLASLGVNGAGLTVMLAVFIQTAGLTGAEAAIAGGTTALGHKVLEAVFGDQAVRSMAARAREDLLTRVERLLAEEAERFGALLDGVAPDDADRTHVRAGLAAVERARG